MPTPPDGAVSPAVAAHLCGRMARLLLANGADAAYALDRVAVAARGMGHETHVVLGDGGVLVTAGGVDRFATRVSRTLPAMAVDVGRIAAVNRSIAVLDRDPAAAARIADDLDTIEHRPPRYAAAVTMVCVAITAASLARLFGAAWPVVAAAFVAGLVSTLLRLRLGAARVNPLAAAFVVALASGIVAALALHLVPGASPVLALTAAGMILVPGVPLINGVRDLVDGHAGIALTRLTLAAATVLTIAFALYLAATIAGDALPVDAAPGHIPVAEDALFSALAVLGYATLFGLPPSALPVAMLCGVASHATRTALGGAGLDRATGSLVGALVAGLLARGAARRLGMPAVSFAFPGTVAMIPGSYGFRAGIGGLHLATLGPAAPPALVADTIALAITTATMTAAIGIGLCLAFACPLPIPEKDD